MDIPTALADRIEQFRNKGRVFAEGLELFNNTSWVAVMLGQNIVPEEYNPIVDGLDEHKVSDAFDRLRAAYVDMTNRLPTQEQFIASCCPAPGAPQAREFAL
jgi:tryptophan halogenase